MPGETPEETKHYLSPLFEANSIAVFGVQEDPNAIGTVVLKNIFKAGFKGKVFPVGAEVKEIDGHECFATLPEAKDTVQMAVIATHAEEVPEVLEQCGTASVEVAVILTTGFRELGSHGGKLERNVLETAHRHGIRLLGPKSLGIARPSAGINATYAGENVTDGNIALISQSGSICTAVMDWASYQNIGLSAVISIGASIDIDFGEILDYLVADSKTRSILLYIEGIRNARTFMSGLRAAARVKPVIVVKAGRHQSSIKAAYSHTGVPNVSDEIFDAALSRAGVVRGMHIGDLFAAATVLSKGLRLQGENLTLITNGGGPAAMACDRASDLDIPLTELSDKTLDALNEVLPQTWSHSNPIDLLGDADVERYEVAINKALDDPQTSGMIVMLTPQGMTDSTAVAEKVVDIKKKSKKPIFACWMGDRLVREGRKILTQAGIPNFRLPETTVQAFAYLTSFYRNQKLLLETPGPLSDAEKPNIIGAKLVISKAIIQGRHSLVESEVRTLLSAFRLPLPTFTVAHSAAEAVVAAKNLGFPVLMKIHSDATEHQDRVEDVREYLNTEDEVQASFNELYARLQELQGRYSRNIVLQSMPSPQSRSLRVGITHDPVFGPVLTFGTAGPGIDRLSDRAVALPPLNRVLAKEMISRTKVDKLLDGHQGRSGVNREALENILLRISEIACELPEVKSLEINPLIATAEGVICASARINIELHAQEEQQPYSHTAIHPYPSQLDQHIRVADGVSCNIRPIRPEDAQLEKDFVNGLSADAKHFRFMHTFQKLPLDMLARFTQIDYDREMALIAVIEEGGVEREIGVARYAINPDGTSCEFAVTVADDWQGKGIARQLMHALIDYARQRGIRRMDGDILADNARMLKFAQSLGFVRNNRKSDHELVRVEKPL